MFKKNYKDKILAISLFVNVLMFVFIYIPYGIGDGSDVRSEEAVKKIDMVRKQTENLLKPTEDELNKPNDETQKKGND